MPKLTRTLFPTNNSMEKEMEGKRLCGEWHGVYLVAGHDRPERGTLDCWVKKVTTVVAYWNALL